MKNFKLLWAILLSACLTIPTATPVMAIEKNELTNEPTMEMTISVDDNRLQEVTIEEVAVQKMNKENISYEEALSELQAEEERIILEVAKKQVAETRSNASLEDTINELREARIIQYKHLNETYVYPKNQAFACRVSATIVTFLDDGKTRYVDRVDLFGTDLAYGEFTCTWSEMSKNATISYDKRSVRFSVLGNFKVTHSLETSAGFDIPGFATVSGSIGQTITTTSETVRPVYTLYA